MSVFVIQYFNMRTFILILLTLPVFFIPTLALAAEPLVPCSGVLNLDGSGSVCQTCHLVQLGNNIIKWLVVVMSIICGLIVVFAGFRMVMSGGSEGELSHAKGMIVNALVGFVILLSAWLIVDTVMKLFVNQAVLVGPWHQIQCVAQPVSVASQTGGGVAGTGSMTTGSAPYTGALSQCPVGNIACSTSALQAGGLTSSQANVMSCIAMTESGGDPNARTTVPGSSACGTFQITQTTWRGAASGSCGSFSNCTNASCNMQVMTTLVQRNASAGRNPYADWTCAGCNAKAQACVDKYK